jgi:hypothetical protein
MVGNSFKRQPEDRRHAPVLFDTREQHIASPAQWYKGEDFQRYPTNDALCSEDGIEFILRGWRPDKPIITPRTRVLALGSCFAANFLDWMEEHGLGENSTFLPYTALFESVAVIEQQFRWAFGEMDPRTAVWVDRKGVRVEATEERRKALRAALEHSDVLILTLGLSEVWFDRVTNEPLWRALPMSTYDAERHEVRILTASQTRDYLESIARLQAQFFPQAKVLFTVSPVAFNATFRPISSVTANAASKAIIRAALDEFLRLHADEVGTRLFYFPSYEMMMDVYRRPFVADNMHPEDVAISRVLALFASAYTSLAEGEGLTSLPELREAITSDAQQQALRFSLASSEKEIEIRNLSKALDERLRVIEVLDAEVQRLRSQIASER